MTGKAQHRILEKWDFKAGNREITVLPASIGTAKIASNRIHAIPKAVL
jgi:hypothetical protein